MNLILGDGLLGSTVIVTSGWQYTSGGNIIGNDGQIAFSVGQAFFSTYSSNNATLELVLQRDLDGFINYYVI
ncbi:MAG: hypothetical protein ABF268_00745 [Polaribacter sp.]